MKVVYKYTLQAVSRQTVALPVGAQILSVAEQKGQVCLWALVDKDEVKEEDRTIICVGTGHTEPNLGELRFFGTVLLRGGALVYHFFGEANK